MSEQLPLTWPLVRHDGAGSRSDIGCGCMGADSVLRLRRMV
ncbi:hypothetical protein [Synechococcus sp. M16CYN]